MNAKLTAKLKARLGARQYCACGISMLPTLLGGTQRSHEYNLAEDLGEQRDVAAEHPDVAARLERLLADGSR